MASKTWPDRPNSRYVDILYLKCTKENTFHDYT